MPSWLLAAIRKFFFSCTISCSKFKFNARVIIGIKLFLCNAYNILFFFSFQKYNNKKIRRRQVSDDFFLQYIYFSPKRFKKRAFLLLYIQYVYTRAYVRKRYFFHTITEGWGVYFSRPNFTHNFPRRAWLFFLFFVFMVLILWHFFGNSLRTYFQQIARVVRVTWNYEFLREPLLAVHWVWSAFETN